MTARPRPVVTLLDTLADPHLFADAFRPTASWAAWRSVLKALFALPPTADDVVRYTTHTGRVTWPSAPCREAWCVVGRRGGKSRIAALVAVYLACFRDYRRLLARGERGHVMVLAADRRQARVVFRYIQGLLDGVPMLAQRIERRTAEALHLSNQITIEVHTASFKAVRGYTVVAAILDEVAFWPADESANPDTEIVNAIRPTMATVPGALLLGISSPYARRGVLWEAYRQHYGQDGDAVLVWQADTRSMNPTLDPSVITSAYADDPASAAAEYGAEFRTDVETFISRDVVDACVVPGRHEQPPVRGLVYRAFTDPSGGSGSDAYTLAIAHAEMRDGHLVAVLDAIREVRPPFSPESTTADFAALCRTYGIQDVTGDRYAGEWPREQFRKHGVTYTVSARAKSDLYRDALPALNAGTVALLDSPRLVAQLCGLERRTSRGGRDSIDHPPNGHDDVANAVCGAIADLLVHAPGADGGAVPMIHGVVRFDLANWNVPPPLRPFNTGHVDWSALDEQDERTRRRYHLP